jgi:hypothetical protein
MNTFRLQFTENMTAHHEIIIETELSEDKFLEELDIVEFDDSRIDDCAYLLEKQLKVNVKEIIEGDPETDDSDCDDVTEIKEV